jgi:hypothetical protein
MRDITVDQATLRFLGSLMILDSGSRFARPE